MVMAVAVAVTDDLDLDDGHVVLYERNYARHDTFWVFGFFFLNVLEGRFVVCYKND